MLSESFTYVQTGRAAAVPADEVETAQPAIEVRVLWGANTLRVAALSPPRDFVLGQTDSGDESDGEDCDFWVAPGALGAPRRPLVLASASGASLVVPPGARGFVDTPGCERALIGDLVSAGDARPCEASPGAYEIALCAGSSARVELACGHIAFCVTAGKAGKRPPRGALADLEPASLMYAGASSLLHLGLVAIAAFFMPRLGADDDSSVDRDQIVTMRKLLDAAAVREEAELATKEGSHADEPALTHRGAPSQAARLEAGAMGSRAAVEKQGRYAVAGPLDNREPRLARDAILHDARDYAEQLLGTLAMNTPSVAAPWGAPSPSGFDPNDALGHMFGDRISDATGPGGLGPSGAGPGGGGPGDFIGLKEIAGLGPNGGPQGVGHGCCGKLGRGHEGSGPQVRTPGDVQLNGHINPELIRRVVRQNFGRFRFCYETGLRQNPALAGRVAVRFVIDRTGAVSLSADAHAETDLPDRGAVECVVRAFRDLSFPAPEAGVVTVVYPLVFSPG